MDHRWEQHRAELFSRDDRAGFWLRTLSAPPDDAEHQADEPPAVQAGTPMSEYAALRESLGLGQLGLDAGQVQMTGRRGDVLTPQMPGREHIRAAAALSDPYGQDARAEYARRQQAAAQLTRSDRSR